MTVNLYNYREGGYSYLAMHRRLLDYDPLNTNNEIILDAFNSGNDKNKRKNTLYYLASLEINSRYNSPNLPEIPPSFNIVLNDINLSWCTIIQQLLFKDQMVDTFFGEYCNVIDKIIKSNTQYKKEYMVYRYYLNGDSVFHLAAKVWLINIKEKNKYSNNLHEVLNKELMMIFSTYMKLGACFGVDMSNSILQIRDNYNKTLRQYLIDFCLDMVNGSSDA